MALKTDGNASIESKNNAALKILLIQVFGSQDDRREYLIKSGWTYQMTRTSYTTKLEWARLKKSYSFSDCPNYPDNIDYPKYMSENEAFLTEIKKALGVSK
jgi:hypothetical protein